MKKEISQRRKAIGYWVLGLLVFGILAVFAFQQIAGYTRSAKDNMFSEEYENNLGRETKRASITELTQYPVAVRTAVQRLLLKHGIQDLDNVSIETVKRMELFNPENPFAPNPLSAAVLQNHTEGQYIFSFQHQFEDAGTETEDLIAFLPQMKKASCLLVISWIQDKNSDEALNIPSLSANPVTKNVVFPLIQGKNQDPELPYGCGEFDNEYYFYRLVYGF